MKSIKRVLAALLCAVTVCTCFAGCSDSGSADEITDETLLIAYTEENKPFIYTDENGKLTGFDVEIFGKIFEDIKNDYKNYRFIQVEEGYKVGEDAAYVNDEGEEFIAYIMAGGLQKDTGTFNEDCTFTENVIDNAIITVTAQGSKITSYDKLGGANVGVVTSQAKAAFEKHSAISGSCKSVKDYSDAKSALADLDSGKLDAVVIDEFSFNVLDIKDNYARLDGELDRISYVYAFKKFDWYVDSVNEAIKELQDPAYNDADEFTPIVEKYFGYNASNFEYESVEE